MQESTKLGRRKFLQLGLIAGLAGLASCGRSVGSSVLTASKETLPREWLQKLPSNWRFKPFKSTIELEKSDDTFGQGIDCLAINDGWLEVLPQKRLQVIDAGPLSSELNKNARAFLESLDPGLANCVFPISVSPWVMLFRKGDSWLASARKDWQVLLDPELKGRIVFPDSPRLVMSLANQMSGSDNLRRLRAQALTFDDRNGLNWLRSKEARVAILPLQRSLKALSSDPRLSIALPVNGAPLNWVVLVSTSSGRESFPMTWVNEGWSSTLRLKLLLRGWIPPISITKLEKNLRFLQEPHLINVLSDEEFWAKSWSLPPLEDSFRENLEKIWEESTP